MIVGVRRIFLYSLGIEKVTELSSIVIFCCKVSLV
jgi:hypothetical protein